MNGADILTFSGWTQPSDALRPIAPDATYVDYARAANVNEVAGLLPQHEVDLVIGWSLGGIVARQLIRQGALKAKALVLIASPYQYVQSAAIKSAMPQDTFDLFYANYRDDTQRTVSRFHGLLVKGDSRMKELYGLLGHHPAVEDTAIWLPWMDFLHSYSAEHEDYSGLPPVLLIHGRQDVVVPYAQSELMQQKLSSSQLLTLEDSAHTPHLHAPEQVQAAIAQFRQQVGA